MTSSNMKHYLEAIDDKRKADVLKLIEIGKKLTHEEPKLWGSIVGFGSIHYVYKTGHQGDMPIFSFANRKQALTLYLSAYLEHFPQLERLGKYKKGKGCLYIKKLSDINLEVLIDLIRASIKETLNRTNITINK